MFRTTRRSGSRWFLILAMGLGILLCLPGSAQSAMGKGGLLGGTDPGGPSFTPPPPPPPTGGDGGDPDEFGIYKPAPPTQDPIGVVSQQGPVTRGGGKQVPNVLWITLLRVLHRGF